MMEWARDILDDPLREYNFIARRTIGLIAVTLFIGMALGFLAGWLG